MLSKNKVFKIVIILACLLGLVIKTGILSGGFKPYTLIYFTNQSNVLLMIVYVFLLVNGRNKSSLAEILYGLALVNILVTFSIYAFVLMPTGFGMACAWTDMVGNILLHFIVLLAVLADFMVFEKFVFKYRYIIIWLGFFVLYFVFLVVQAKMGGFIPNQNTKYPYAFIAVDLLGWDRALNNCGLTAVFYTLLSAAFVKFSRIKSKISG